MYRTDDPLRDFDRWDERRQRALDRLPRCCECGEPIQTEEFFEFDEGKIVCPACLEENHQRYTDDYIG
jgi:formylmethanofuran dehydrogenase subunit E